jgi:hypothetical protein
VPDRFTLSVSGREGLERTFRGVSEESKREIEVANLEGAGRIYRAARDYTPVRTYFMRNHLRMRLTRFTYEIGWDANDFFSEGFAFYPEYVEYGTRFMDGQFPLTRAYDENQSAYVDGIRRSQQRALRAAA